MPNELCLLDTQIPLVRGLSSHHLQLKGLRGDGFWWQQKARCYLIQQRKIEDGPDVERIVVEYVPEVSTLAEDSP